MKTSEKGLGLIKHFEGLRLKSYLCPGRIRTVGYGTTRIDGHPVLEGLTITKAQAEEYLANDVVQFEDIIKVLVRIPLNQNQFDALVSFTYNLGGSALESSTLLRKLNRKEYTLAANEFLKWIRAGGKELPGLIARRAAEKELFEA
jgi:lysozyme